MWLKNEPVALDRPPRIIPDSFDLFRGLFDHVLRDSLRSFVMLVTLPSQKYAPADSQLIRHGTNTSDLIGARGRSLIKHKLKM